MELSARVERSVLFETPVWMCDLDVPMDALRPDVDRLLVDLVDSSRPFRQTHLIEPVASSVAWDEFFHAAAVVVSTVVADGPGPRPERLAHASWILSISDPSEFAAAGGVVDALHSHPGARVATVFYLQVPPEVADDPRAGTLVRSPYGPVADDWFDPNFYLAPAPGRLVAFAAQMEHGPSAPEGSGAFSVPRIVVVTNWF